MLRAELIKSCTHEKVAEAAVLSIGADFHRRLALLGGAVGLGPGAYAAELVRRFADEADEHDWETLSRVIAARDMPILCGLRWIVETMIEGDRSGGRGGGPSVSRRAERRDCAPDCCV
jgi:hypothetical protein